MTSEEREQRIEPYGKAYDQLVGALVLRCDDCVTYHLERCREEGATREELLEVLNIGLVVGGSITIPHLRRAFGRLREIEQKKG